MGDLQLKDSPGQPHMRGAPRNRGSLIILVLITGVSKVGGVSGTTRDFASEGIGTSIVRYPQVLSWYMDMHQVNSG